MDNSCGLVSTKLITTDYTDNNYNDYRDTDSDLDLDWERFSDFVTQSTITNKLQNLNDDIEG